MRIPTYDRQVAPSGQGLSPIDSSAPAGLGAATDIASRQSQAMQQGVASIDQAAQNYMQHEQDKLDAAVVLDATNRLSQFETEAVYGESGYLSRRGRNALGVAKEAQQAYGEQVGKIADDLKLSDNQRLAFNHMASRRGQVLTNSLASHEMQQRDAYMMEQADSRLSLDADNAARSFNNPDAVDFVIGSSDSTIRAAAAAYGYSPEKTDLAIQSQRSRIRTAVIDKMIGQDPRTALEYFNQHRDDFTAQDSDRVGSVLSSAVRKVDAQDAADAAYQVAGVTADSVWKTMVGTESKGRQFDRNGKPLTSPKGAIGIAQVMPKTAPEAARLAGLPWDESRYKTDPEYNMALGKAYYDSQLKKYGDPILAAAAYNAGPGAADKWLKEYGDPRHGEISVTEWASKIPYKETKKYVAGILRDNFAGGSERSESLALGALRSIQDPETRRMATSLVQERLALDKQTRDEQYSSALNQASDIVQRTGSFGNVPPSLWAQLKPDDRAKLQGGPVKASDPNTLNVFELNPDRITVEAVKRARANLTESDFRHYMKIAQDPNKEQKTADAKIDNDMFGLGLAVAGLSFDSKKPDQAQQELDLRMKYKRMIDQEQQRLGRGASMDEKQKLLNMLLKPVKVRAIEHGFLGDSLSTMDKHVFEVKDQRNIIVPADAQSKIAADFHARGIKPTPERVRAAYLQMR